MGDIFPNIEEDFKVTREEFNNLSQPLFDEIEEITKRTLERSRYKPEDIQEVLLVGGSSRIPKIQELLQQIFPNKCLNMSVNQDEAIATGATIYAAQLCNSSSMEVPTMSLIEATPLSLGVSINNGLFSVIIERNTRLPITIDKTYFSLFNNQKSISFEVSKDMERFIIIFF